MEEGEDASAADNYSAGDKSLAPAAEAPVEETASSGGGSNSVMPAAANAEGYDASQEIPAGTEMKSTSVREALRDAMAEEMRGDERVFIMGEEVAEYQGLIKSPKVCWMNLDRAG